MTALNAQIPVLSCRLLRDIPSAVMAQLDADRGWHIWGHGVSHPLAMHALPVACPHSWAITEVGGGVEPEGWGCRVCVEIGQQGLQGTQSLHTEHVFEAQLSRLGVCGWMGGHRTSTICSIC
jgi:hypothetical protein